MKGHVVIFSLVLCFAVIAKANQTFSDNFDDGDLAGWSQKNGSWTLGGSGDKYLSSNDNYGVIWKDGSFGVDQKLQVDAYFDLNAGVADQIAHLRLRTNTGSPNTYWDTGYLAEVQLGMVRIYNTHLGGNPVIASYNFGSSPIDSTGWYTLDFEVTGTGSDTHFKLSVNDVLYIDADYNNSIEALDSGYIGLGRQIKYDNFQSSTNVVPLPGAVLLAAIGIGCVRWLKKRKSI